MIIKYSKSLLDAAKKVSEDVKDKGFYQPGDLEDNKTKVAASSYSLDDINEYLVSVISGREYEPVCELGILSGAGEIIVSFSKLKQMVDEGYNIVKAEAFNADIIVVKFQKYIYDEEKMKKWRRF